LFPTDKLSVFTHKASQGGAVKIYEAKLSHRAIKVIQKGTACKLKEQLELYCLKAAVDLIKPRRLLMNSPQSCFSNCGLWGKQSLTSHSLAFYQNEEILMQVRIRPSASITPM